MPVTFGTASGGAGLFTRVVWSNGTTEGGSSGGHHGIDSIIQELGSDAFVRLRVGIGRPLRGQSDPVDYVLEDFNGEQCSAMAAAREHVAEAVRVILTEGVAQAMNTYNGL